MIEGVKLTCVYRLDDDCNEVGVTHVAWWDPDAEYYWLVCGTRQGSDAVFISDHRRSTSCKRCRRAKLARFRLVRWAARTWEGR